MPAGPTPDGAAPPAASAAPDGSGAVGVVVIGRNEGERLVRCLRSIDRGAVGAVVYVDSGSTDGSVAAARAWGADVVELTPDRPFTAARGRNAGFAHLCAQPSPGAPAGAGTGAPTFVQFLDGDTELFPTWLARAHAALAADANVAAVCGRRRERAPQASVYNLLCDVEWNTPVGPTLAFGGDVMIRAADLAAVSGYDETLIAGEDPDLSLRLRLRGCTLLRIDADMTWHDAALLRFAQWWKRTERAGHAYAEGAARFGGPPAFHWRKETRSIWLFGLAVPFLGMALAVPTFGLSALGAASLYPVLFLRVLRHAERAGLDGRTARRVAAFTTLAKFPQAKGQLSYWRHRLGGRRRGLIEYK